MRIKEIEEGIVAKKTEEEKQKKSGINIKKTPVVIEYEDMTEHQKKTVDAGMDDEHVTIMPKGLTREERVQWIYEQMMKAKR